MRITKKNKRRRLTSYILALLMFFSNMGGLIDMISYAAPPTITDISLQTISAVGSTETKVIINGAGLAGAEARINNTNLAGITGVKITNTNNGFYEAVFPASSGFNFQNGLNTLTMTSGADSATRDFNLATPLPTLSGVNRNIYVGQSLAITGNNLRSSYLPNATADNVRLFIGLRENNFSDIPAGTQINILNVDSQTGSLYSVEFQIKYNAPATGIPATYSYILKDSVYPLKIIEGLENLRVTPRRGPTRGGTILSINAVDGAGVIKEDEDLFKDGMTVELRGAEPTNRGKVFTIPQNQIQLITKAGKGIGLQVTTPDVRSQTNVVGKYDVVIKQGGIADAEAIAPEGFEYLSTMPTLDLSSVNEKTGVDTGGQNIILKGSNIIDYESLGLTITGGGSVTVNSPANLDGDALKITYTVGGALGDVKYGDFVIPLGDSITRTIEARVGNVAKAVEAAITNTEITTPPFENHYSVGHTSKNDGVVFETSGINPADPLVQDVTIETRTIISVRGAGGQNIQLPTIIERDIIKNGFTFIRTKIDPKITSVEPLYGYYNKIDNDPIKPLMLRIKGTESFQVEVDADNNPIYPKVELRKLDGQPLFGLLNPDRIKVDVKKVLIGDRPVDGVSDKYGDTMIVEIYPVNPDGTIDNTFKLNEINGLWTSEALFKRLRTNFLVTQTSGNNGGDVGSVNEPYFEFRYPQSPAISNIQPVIEGVYQNGFPVTNLSSDIENQLEVRFKANNVTDLNSVIVTLDGIDLGKAGRITGRSVEDDFISIKFRTPRNIVGDTRLQVIVREGLMDSFDDLFFSPVSGPILKEIIPNKGQRGTWITIKRDAVPPQSARFVLPDKDASGIPIPDTGTVVLVNGVKVPLTPITEDIDGNITGNYEVKDINTIVFQIPSSIDSGNNIIQVENPSGGRSQGVFFEVINPTTPTKIGSIDPDRGDWQGGIIATLKAGSGTSFAGELDVYFASQKAQVLGYNIDFTEAYVRVPRFQEKVLAKGESYSVPVTAVNKERFSTDTLVNGYTYINPDYTMEITNIFKDGSQTNAPDRNKGLAGDIVIIEGKEIRAIRKDGDLISKPLIYFGNTRVQDSDIISWDITPGTPPEDPAEPDGQIVNLDRVRVKVPPRPQNAAQDGSVTVMVINPDGATAIKDKGFIYSTGNPQILKDSSILKASRFFDTIDIVAKDVDTKDNLIVAFGEKIYRRSLTSGPQSIVTDQQQERIRVTYLPNDPDGNVKIEYQYIDGNETKWRLFDVAAGDLYDYRTGANIPSGQFNVNLGEENQRLIGIKWNKEEYHKAAPITNPDLLQNLNDEIVSVKIVRQPSSTMNELVVRRGLGKIENYNMDTQSRLANIRIKTPYNDRVENTKIFLINSDGTFASEAFEFTGGVDIPEITAVAGTKDRQITLNGVNQTSKVFTQDVNLDTGVIKIEGKNFREIDAVRIGGVRLDIDAVSPDGDWILARVKKGTQELVGRPQVITVTTKSGTASSDSKSDPKDKIYFMYISPGSTPKITSVTPQVGISDPGNLIRIAGEGFSNKDEFGVGDTVAPDGTTVEKLITANINGTDAPITSIERDAQKNILAVTIRAQKGEPGKATITVINGDGGSATAPFDRISQPKITEVRTADGGPVLFNDTGAELVIIGEEFQTGAKVFIGSSVSTQNTEGAVKVAGVKGLTATGTNQSVYVLDGYEGVSVEFVNSKTLKFKLPEGILDLEKESIIVVNPDTGVSNEFEDTNIKPPVPDVPDIEAIPGFERSMILRWKVDQNVLNAAEKFEIYAREDRSSADYVFVGDTKGNEFIVRGLKPDTRYQFNVRVLNKFGQANDVGYVRATTLRERDDYKEQDKIKEAENTVREIETQGKQEVVGNSLQYTVGTSENFINLANFNQNEKYVQIPVREIKRGVKTLTISDRGMTMNIPYSSLNVSQISSASDDAFFRIKLASVNNQMQESIGALVPRNMSRNSRVYSIDFEIVDRRLTSPVFSLNGSASMSIIPDRGTSTNNTIYRYNEAGHNLIPVGAGSIQLRESGHYLLLSPR